MIVTETATRNLSITVEESLPSTNMGTSMTDGSESHEEATNTTREALNTAKTKIRIGFWNVRTIYAAGKLAQITAEMQRYKLHILGISESRWTESGKIRTTTGKTVIERKTNQHDVAPVLCPTNDSSVESKDAFYEQLQNELDRTPQHDIKIIMGDMNVKVGSSNMHYDRAMEKHGCGCMNENGKRLAEFCTTNNYVIGGTLFPHRDIHKLTGYSPNLRDKNQIDHIMINGTWRRSLLDVRVKRGADIESDHHLVTALIKLKLRGTKQVKTTVRHFDIDRLKDTRVKKELSIQVKNRFQALQNLPELDERDSIDKKWERVADIYRKCRGKCIGFRQQQKTKDWITPDTWAKISAGRDIKKKMNEAKSSRLKERLQLEYSEIQRDVKKITRTDKRSYMDKLASKAEEAANKGEQDNLYKITKTICGKSNTSSNVPIKDKQGKLLTPEKEQEIRWTEHFQEN
ncbi:craniofacial development protein 2-like [Ostrea edulis]|uniref:craniofacial development protein 2-like n=1 Tax=Ostrea edulis TaxID=37623 RepID=UPI0024AFE913|nr:craniofacial development protein 2-like [Ostrea edulis]